MLLWVLFIPNSYAADNGRFSFSQTSDIVCPQGFISIPSGLGCMAANFTTIATADAPPWMDCPDGFERPPGIRFCIAENMKLDIQDNIKLISMLKTRECPVNFSRPTGSTICVADNLVVDVIDNEVTLTAYIDNCSEGFHRPVGIRFCIAENLTLLSPPTAPSFCPPGFIKPPGIHFCIASELLYKNDTRRNEIAPTVGLCPKGWVKPDYSNFCQPSHITSSCGQNCGTQKGVSIHTIDDIKPVPCPAGTVESWWDMPEYDKEGLFVIGSIPTRTCIPEDLQPAR